METSPKVERSPARNRVERCSVVPAVGGRLHRLPHGVEPVRHRVHVGGVWRPQRGAAHGFRRGGNLRQVLHPLQPHHIPGLQAQLPQVPVPGRGPVPHDAVQVPVSAWPVQEGDLREVPSQGGVQLHPGVQRAARQPRRLQTLPLLRRRHLQQGLRQRQPAADGKDTEGGAQQRGGRQPAVQRDAERLPIDGK